VAKDWASSKVLPKQFLGIMTSKNREDRTAEYTEVVSIFLGCAQPHGASVGTPAMPSYLETRCSLRVVDLVNTSLGRRCSRRRFGRRTSLAPYMPAVLRYAR
jgi:hypothetical protein